MSRALAALLIVVACSRLVAGREATTASHSIESLAFMGGHWVGEGLGGRIEEGWFPPRDGNMVGVFRLSGAERGLSVMESLMIEQEGERVVYRFRHFGKGMKAWEDNDKPLTFHLVEVSDGRAVFDAPDRAQKPARLVYAVADGRMTVDVVSLKTDGSEDESFRVEYDRFRR